MDVSVTGDFATLNKMRKRLSATVGAPERAAKLVAPELEAATLSTFSTETSPSGKAWKADRPKTYALGTKSILDRTGALKGSITVVAVGPSVRISVAASYYRFQRGKRDPIPTKSRIPKQWNGQVRAAVFRSFREILGGK